MGRQTLRQLHHLGMDITYLSRKRLPDGPSLSPVIGERSVVSNKIENTFFDAILDFTAYQVAEVQQTLSTVKTNHYILISSAWVTQKETGIRKFSTLENRYVSNKIAIERFLMANAHKDFDVTIIRFPIVLGFNDHSGRLNYLTRRILQSQPITICRDITGPCSFVCVQDAAKLITSYVLRLKPGVSRIIDALPPQDIEYKYFLNLIGLACHKDVKTIEADQKEIQKWFPQFFEVDPFWRERPYPIKNHNAFDEVKVNVASYRSWLPKALKFAGDEAETLIGKTSKRPWNNVKFLASEKKWCDWQYDDV